MNDLLGGLAVGLGAGFVFLLTVIVLNVLHGEKWNKGI